MRVDFWAVEGKSAQGGVSRENAVAGLRAAEPVAQAVAMRRLSTEALESIGVPSSVDLVKVDVEGAEAAALRGLADVRWRYLAIETSVGRDGGLTVDAAVDLVERSAGSSVRLCVWRASARAGAVAIDAILSRP